MGLSLVLANLVVNEGDEVRSDGGPEHGGHLDLRLRHDALLVVHRHHRAS